MYRHILLATDGSELADRAVSDALDLAKSLVAKVTAVTVTDILPTGPYSPIPCQTTSNGTKQLPSRRQKKSWTR